MAERKYKFIKRLPLCDDRCLDRVIKALWLLLLLYPFHQFYYFRFEYTEWDLLLFTGVAALILGLRLAAKMPERFRDLIARLENRQVLELGAINREELLEKTQENGDLRAREIGVLVALALGAAFLYVLFLNFTWQMLFLGLAEMIAGYIAGNYLGRMVSYGLFGRHLKKWGLGVKVDPFHVDGVGGLKPIGDYYFYQAMVVGIPAIFLAIWWFLFPIWPRDYSYWENAYLFLMSIAFILEIAAFVFPLLSFHEFMVKQKRKKQKDADNLGNQLTDLQRFLDSKNSEEEKKLAISQIKEYKEQYWAIENMATWPVDIGTRHQFRINNILLIMPIMGDLAKRNLNWDKVYGILKSLSS